MNGCCLLSSSSPTQRPLDGSREVGKVPIAKAGRNKAAMRLETSLRVCRVTRQQSTDSTE
jgi:hypothetical protein